jgi:hypothetical protein
VLLDFTETAVSFTWEAAPASDATASIQGLDNQMDAAESATMVIARGEDAYGNAIWAYVLDTQAESSPLSDRWCPWREVEQENIDGTCTPWALVTYAQGMASRYIPLQFTPELEVPGRLTLRRRQRVQVTGTTAGVKSSDEYRVATLRHVYRQPVSECKTYAGLQRLGI